MERKTELEHQVEGSLQQANLAIWVSVVSISLILFAIFMAVI
jgi:hypothetical protein